MFSTGLTVPPVAVHLRVFQTLEIQRGLLRAPLVPGIQTGTLLAQEAALPDTVDDDAVTTDENTYYLHTNISGGVTISTAW